MRTKAALKLAETLEKTTWEEPSLFPQRSPQQASYNAQMQKASSPDISNISDPSASPEGEPPSGLKHNASAFHAEFGNLGSNHVSSVGLESIRQRDAILARLQDTDVTQPYNIKIGRLPLRLAASFDADFTDNSDRMAQAPQADMTLLPRLDITGSVRLGSTTTLTIGLGVGYIKYLVKTDRDRVLTLASLNPDNGVSLDVKMGKFIISIYDKPIVPQFQADAVTQRNLSQYSQFSNTAGVNILWSVNSRTNVSVRYDHSNQVSLTSAENTSDGSMDSFLTSLSCTLSDSLGVGIEAGAEAAKSKGNVLNDGTTYHIGPVVNCELSQYLSVQASFGFQGGEYESTGSVKDSSTLSAYYASVGVANNLNSQFRHSLSFGQESQRGSFSNYTLSKYLRYQASWDLIQGVRLGASAAFQDIKESGGIFAEHFRNMSFGMYCGLNVTAHISFSLAYTYTRRYSMEQGGPNQGLLDYDENRVALHIGYAF